MSPEFEAKVIADLEKTGFPSEFQVRRTIYLRSGRWDSTGTMGFFDLDEQKLRQIDVYAFMPCGDRVSRKNSTHTVWNLIIEVKKSEGGKPWVVFKERRDVIRDVLLWHQDLVSFCNLPAAWDKNFSWRIYENSPCKGLDWIGAGIHESFKQPSEASRPYAAMMSLIKAAEHFHGEHHAAMKDSTPVTEDISEHPTRVFFIRPVLVLDGELLSAELDGAGKLKVSEIDFAPLHVGYKTASYTRERYRVDVVRLSALDGYLASTEKQHDAIRKAILDLGGLGAFTEDEIYNGAKPKRPIESKDPGP
ncbi:MAG: hypothetical protein PSV13_14180 [Lacunisphaera sp.]|nr:hypothetical protein [Lacunisphaera sp.]